MRKMPCVFDRTFHDGGGFTLHETRSAGLGWLDDPKTIATVKWDGTACLVEGGRLHARYDAKKGKAPPPGFKPCQDAPDPMTGHWPGWVLVESQPHYKHHAAAFTSLHAGLEDGTYELCGPHFQANPHRLPGDRFVRHGRDVVHVAPSFVALRAWLDASDVEGIVFYGPSGERAKIRRGDFGLSWPIPVSESASVTTPAE